MVTITAAVLALALAGPSEDPVTLQGIGLLRIGLPVAMLRGRFGAAEEEGDPESDCSYWTSPSYPDLAMMVVGGRLVRIDIAGPGYRTRSGAAVGMSESDIRAIYGRLMTVEPHPYTEPEGHYLVYRARDEPYGMIVETDNGRAVALRVGYWENVQWIEGCS